MCSNELQVATPRTGTALEGLPRRFPKVSARSSRNAATGRYERSNTFRPYPNVRRTVGRPLTSKTVSKDIVISLEFGIRRKVSWKDQVESSGHPTTVFCKISFRRSKYCLEFSITWGRLKIYRWPFHSCTIFEAYKFPTIFWSLIFTFYLSKLGYFSFKRGT